MPLKTVTNKNFLRVSNGRICKTVPEGTKDSISRVTKKGETVWELIWESASGVLDSVDFRDHPEYGKSWTLTVIDGTETFGIQVHEDSRYGMELLKKIPNLYHGRLYIFRPYEYEKNGKTRAGIEIKDEAGNKIQSFYQKFTDNGDGTWLVEDLHDFPKFDGDSKDKDDLKIYFVRLAKWLRAKATLHLTGDFYKEQPATPAPEEQMKEPEAAADDGLPF